MKEKFTEKLIKKAKSFPNKPGVYWFSKNGKRIYVGKAASLKKRISNYFRNKDPRINTMVYEANNVSFKKTSSVLEAIILEANAIKKYWPKYNIKEKDNRSFVYLVISKGSYPKIFIARGREVEKYGGKNHIFGPYQSYRILKTALTLARKIFPFGMCQPLDGARGKPCFDYQIGLCPGICVGAISKKDYQKNIRNLILFFKGEHKRLFKKLKKPARIATQSVAGGENPEKFFALQHINDIALLQNSKFEFRNSKFAAAGRIEGYDISHFGGMYPVGAMVVFRNGLQDKSQYRLFKIKGIENKPLHSNFECRGKFDDLAMLREVLERRFNHSEWPKPDLILIDGGKNQIKITKQVLMNRNIFIPIVGIAKILGHSGSAYGGDKLFFENTKPSVKKLLLISRLLFQQVRNEAHRFAISFQRKHRLEKIK